VQDEGDTLEPRLPRRRGPLRVGTHRAEEVYDDDTPTVFERVRDSAWFVPLLLALLALLLILGAYAVGRRFAGEVQGSASSSSGPTLVTEQGGVDGRDQLSRTIVTGPSLASSTVMSAPKTPRWT
jgi:hypothetical protein